MLFRSGRAELRQRIHGDLHLGQVLATPRGALLVDFEGDPMREVAERCRPASPLRDLASFLRSLDHALRSGIRRVGVRQGAPLAPERVASAEAWLADARFAFLGAYGQPVDPVLLRAHELEKAMLEFAYAATFLPSWLYAPAGALGTLLPKVRE